MTERRPPVITGPPKRDPSGNQPAAPSGQHPPTRPPTGNHPTVGSAPVHGFRVPSGAFSAVPGGPARQPSGTFPPVSGAVPRQPSGTYAPIGGQQRAPTGTYNSVPTPTGTRPLTASGSVPAVGGRAGMGSGSVPAVGMRQPTGTHEDISLLGLLGALTQFLRASLMYAPEHPHGVQAAQRFAVQLPQYMEIFATTELILLFDGRHIHAANRSVRVDSPDLDKVRWLVDRIQHFQLAEFVFRHGTSEIDLVALGRQFADAEKTGKFAEIETSHVRVMHARYMPELERLLGDVLPLSRYPILQLYAEAIARTMEWARAINDRRPIDPSEPKRLVGQLIDASYSDPSGLLGMVTLLPLPGSISNRRLDTAIVATSIALGLELGDAAARDIGIAALLRPLPNPWQPWWSRPALTADVAVAVASAAITDLDMVTAFESSAGLGLTVPDSYYGHETNRHIATRIIAVAEAWIDLLQPGETSSPASPDIALLALVAGAGTRFDAVAVKALLQQTGVFPPGTVVRLNSGDIAVVTHAPPVGGDPRRPTVRPLDASSVAVYPLYAPDLAPYSILGSEQPFGLPSNPCWAFLR